MTIGNELYKKHWADQKMLLSTGYKLRTYKGLLWVIFEKIKLSLKAHKFFYKIAKKIA